MVGNAPQPGDRVVSGDAGRWKQYRYKVDGTITRPQYHASREAALRQAARLANQEGVRLFVWEKSANDDQHYRLVTRPVR